MVSTVESRIKKYARSRLGRASAIQRPRTRYDGRQSRFSDTFDLQVEGLAGRHGGRDEYRSRHGGLLPPRWSRG